MSHIDVLSKYTLSEIVADKKEMVVANDDMSIEDAAGLMASKNIRALPVWDTKKECYLGIVDMLDVVGWLCFQRVFNEAQWKPEDFDKFVNTSSFKAIGDIVGATEEGKQLWVYGPQEPIVKVLEPMSKGVHRVLVSAVDDRTRRHTYRLVTQTDIVAFFNKLGKELGDVVTTRIEELGLVNPAGDSIVHMKSSEPAIDGFRKIFIDQIQSVPVMDANGKLVAVLSSSDLRGLTSDKLKHITEPVLDFLKAVHDNKRAVHPVTCTPRDSLDEVITKAFAAKVHRVWVTDSAEKVIGVVTLSDMITKLSPFDFKQQQHAKK